MSQQSDLRREPLLDSLRKELEGLDRDDLLWRIRTLQSPSAPHAKVDGKNVLVLCSNNYLGLANHPKLKQAAIAATRKYDRWLSNDQGRAASLQTQRHERSRKTATEY